MEKRTVDEEVEQIIWKLREDEVVWTSMNIRFEAAMRVAKEKHEKEYQKKVNWRKQ